MMLFELIQLGIRYWPLTIVVAWLPWWLAVKAIPVDLGVKKESTDV